MFKSRTLTKDLGISQDAMYYAASGQTSTHVVATDPELQKYQDARIVSVLFDTMSKRNATIYNPSSYAGSEAFESTENRRPAFNNCRHLKDKFVNYPYACMRERRRVPTTLYYEGFYRMADPSGTSPYSGGATSFGDWESAARRAWWTMQPRFEGDVSMLNFIFELKDFRDIAKMFLKLRNPSLIGKQMRIFRSKLRRIDQRLAKPDASLADVVLRVKDAGMSASKITAQIYLANEFALKPLISDCATILAQAGTIVREAQEEFQSRGQATQIRHYSEDITISDTVTPGTSNNYWFGRGTFHKERFTATLAYKYNYTMRKDSDAFLTYWGLKLTPEVIWNATPFTFLADYFIKVGDALHAMKKDPRVTLMPTQYCESILSEYNSGYIAVGDPRANLTINGKYPVVRGDIFSGHTGSLYQRRVTEPNQGTALPRLSLPSGRQGINMAALAMCFIK